MEGTNRNSSGGAEARESAGVLIVDDDNDNLRLLKICFEMEGFCVRCASSGDEALALLKLGPFSLMLTDYNMPGMDGLRLSAEARKGDPQLIIIMATGDPLTQLAPRAAELGIVALLAKPLNISELISVVSINLSRGGPNQRGMISKAIPQP